LPKETAVHFTGGEIFHYPEIGGLLELAASKFQVTLVTNGQHLSHDKCCWLADLSPRQVTVSVHGPPDIHDAVTGVKGSWARTQSAVGALAKTLGGERLTANFVLLQENWSSLAETAEALAKRGVSKLVVQLFDANVRHAGIAAGGTLYRPQASPRWAKDTLQRVEVHLERCVSHPPEGMAVQLGSDMPPFQMVRALSGDFQQNAWRCADVFDTLRIGPLGDVYTCTGEVLGSLCTRPWHELWHDPGYVAFRGARRSAPVDEACAGCCKLRRAPVKPKAIETC
jgi:MoaA/NifB/PqqE/SkfB family radical SAM enzyme